MLLYYYMQQNNKKKTMLLFFDYRVHAFGVEKNEQEVHNY